MKKPLTVCAGVDLSLRATGLVIWDGHKVLDRQIISTTPENGSVERRSGRIGRIVTDTLKQHKVEYVGLEGAAYGKSFRQFDMGRLHGVVRYMLESKGWFYILVPPTDLKLWAAGRGNAPKADMVAAAKTWLPDATHDEADALHLARYVYTMASEGEIDEEGALVLHKPGR